VNDGAGNDRPVNDAPAGHGGDQAVAAATAHGVGELFTLSGAHVFPVYDAAVRTPGFRIVDVRHEQTAVFAAEATARLTRRPGFAVVTAGPGVTNAVSAITSARFNGAPVLILGGRAPQARWGTGALQELDQPPILAPVTKLAQTVADTSLIASAVDHGFAVATQPTAARSSSTFRWMCFSVRPRSNGPDLPDSAQTSPTPTR
jgi:acetolactate synthase I/II/III large subunit